MKKVIIDGIEYIPRNTVISAHAMKLLHDIYMHLYIEAYYDPTNKFTQEYAKPLADKMTELNKELGFKK